MKKKEFIARHKQLELDSSLIEAVVGGDAEEVARLLKAGASPNAENSEGFTALHFTALSGNAGIAAILIAKGASVTLTDKNGQSATTIAQKRGHREVADLLLRSFFGNGNER